jgi:CheY-like chemotaxis protein
LIVLDLMMPVMDGLEAARVLKQAMPRVPVILYSSTLHECPKRLAKAIGISATVSKCDRISVLIDKARALVLPRAA